MKKFAILFALLCLMLCIVPCFADTAVEDSAQAVIGGADGPTAILVAEQDGFGIHPENFVSNLYYMLVGMVGIFIVIGIIILATILLNKLFRGKAE